MGKLSQRWTIIASCTLISLVDEFISEGLEKSVSPNIRSLIEALASTATGRESFEGVSISQIAGAMNRDIAVVSRAVRKATEKWIPDQRYSGPRT